MNNDNVDIRLSIVSYNIRHHIFQTPDDDTENSSSARTLEDCFARKILFEASICHARSRLV